MNKHFLFFKEKTEGKASKVIYPFTLLLIIFSFSLVQADEFGYNFLSDGENLNPSGNTFIKLKDTPVSYGGNASNCLIVNAGETAVEFGSCGSGGNGTGKSGDGLYLYNNTATMFFNDTLLNLTIDSRAGADNASWNQSFANELFYNKSEVYNKSETYNKSEIDNIASAIAFDFFFTNLTSDITGHYNLTETDEGRAESSLTTGGLSTGDTIVANFTTEIGQPEFNELRKGIYDARLHLFKTGTKSVTLTPQLYNISADGLTKTLLLTFATSVELTTIDAVYDLHGTLNEEIILSPGDRLHMEFIATVGSSGSTPTITIVMEGTTDTHFSIATSSNAFEQIFLRQDGTKPLTGNWDAELNITVNGGEELCTAENGLCNQTETDLSNVAWQNQSNTFTDNQIFSSSGTNTNYTFYTGTDGIFKVARGTSQYIDFIMNLTATYMFSKNKQLKLGSIDEFGLDFITNGTERLTITKDGNVSIVKNLTVNGGNKVCTSENGFCNQTDIGGNPFDQSLNTTDNVTFNDLNTTNLIVGSPTSLDQGLNVYSNWSRKGGLNLLPVDENGYTQIRFYPEGNLTRNTGNLEGIPSPTGDVLINVHKQKPDGELHQHFSIYTIDESNSSLSASMVKRLDINYGEPIANITFSNSLVKLDTGSGTYLTARPSGVADEGYVIVKDARSNAGKGFEIQTHNTSNDYLPRLFVGAGQDIVEIDVADSDLNLNSNNILNAVLGDGTKINDGNALNFGTNDDARLYFRSADNVLRLVNASGTSDSFAIVDFSTNGTKEATFYGNVKINTTEQVCTAENGLCNQTDTTNLTNVAYVNESNTFTKGQIFNTNITVASQSIYDSGGTSFWEISGSDAFISYNALNTNFNISAGLFKDLNLQAGSILMQKLGYIPLHAYDGIWSMRDTYSQGNIYPYTTTTYDLGSASLEWNNLYAKTLIGEGSQITNITHTSLTNVAFVNETEQSFIGNQNFTNITINEQFTQQDTNGNFMKIYQDDSVTALPTTYISCQSFNGAGSAKFCALLNSLLIVNTTNSLSGLKLAQGDASNYANIEADHTTGEVNFSGTGQTYNWNFESGNVLIEEDLTVKGEIKGDIEHFDGGRNQAFSTSAGVNYYQRMNNGVTMGANKGYYLATSGSLKSAWMQYDITVGFAGTNITLKVYLDGVNVYNISQASTVANNQKLSGEIARDVYTFSANQTLSLAFISDGVNDINEMVSGVEIYKDE